MIIKIAIADENREYAEKMLDILEGYEKISLSIYTDKRILEQILNAKHFDVLLFVPSVFDEQTGGSFVLAGGKGLGGMDSFLGEDINCVMKTRSLLQSEMERLFYLRQSDGSGNICEMTEADLKELVKRIGKTEMFDHLIIDMEIVLLGRAIRICEAAEKIVLLEKGGACAMRKLECFLAQVYVIKECGSKTYRAFHWDMGRGSKTSAEIPIIGKIGPGQNSGAAQFVTMLAGDAGGNRFMPLCEGQ